MNYVNFHLLAHQKNEPKTNPILPTILSIYDIACALGGKYLGGLCGYKQKMQNEPNLQNTKINVNPFKTKDYMRNDVFTPQKNEPNLL